ncbi:hypothetical protein M1446_05355 [Candidatus Dependentiae bacterium]|nr:hypothetical protein [Candidatus Dependentiae bacterium]
MNFAIIGPMSKKTLTISWLEAVTENGSYIIQPGHIPMILTLKDNSNVTYCLNSGKIETVEVLNSFIEITRNSVTLLTGS